MQPMKDAVSFESPQSMEVTMELPHHGTIKGMGIKKGITLIVGGGYHGKSTLLKALESGVYNHIAGDGREYVITDDSAVKLRAEDGRSIQKQIFPCLFRIFRMEKYNGILYGGCQWKHLAGGKYRRSNGGGLNPVFDR